MKLSEKITRRLDERGQSQIWLAAAVGSNPTQVARWADSKKGKSSRPSYRELLMISRALELPLEYLCDDECDDPAKVSKESLTREQRKILEIAGDVGYELALKRLLALPGTPVEVRGVPTYSQMQRDGNPRPSPKNL